MGKSAYNFGERLLHRLALGLPLVGKMSFEMDTFIPARRQQSASAGKHVFISGLARAGTTVLMRSFYATGRFRSLTYRDMPFVLMPRLWKRLFGMFYLRGEAEERAHGDGIQVDFDSPEAFEEVFWRTFSGEKYIFEHCLRPYRVDQELSEQFRDYVANIVESADDPRQLCYLSKNNNNILRLDAIRREFPDALIIIPFRTPAQHAFSLLQQHVKFCEKGASDEFSVRYMTWLGHYEFGVGHKPFSFEAGPTCPELQYQASEINYWLSVWIATYEYLLLAAPAGSIFVSFEALCAEPESILQRLFELAEVGAGKAATDNAIRLPNEHKVDGLDAELIARAEKIHLHLCERMAARAACPFE